MVLVLNEAVTGRATHVFVVGISRYTHLEGGAAPTPAGKNSKLKQLSSAARSASEFAAWVMGEYHNPEAPLKTLEVCLAPQPNEQINPAIAQKLSGELDAGRDAVLAAWVAFRDRCLESSDAVAIVYVAGHGVQLTKHGATLLLEDFGAPGQRSQLDAAIDVTGLHNSLYASAAAELQFWFVDTCRQTPAVARNFEALQGAYRDDERLGKCRASPLYLASAPEGMAWARKNGVSVFNEALLAGLRGAAAVGPIKRGGSWRVTIASLASQLIRHVENDAEAVGLEQQAGLDGHPNGVDEVLHHLPTPPQARVLIDLQPQGARATSKGSLSLNGSVKHAVQSWPMSTTVPAGLYLFSIETVAPYQSDQHPLDVKPPELVDSFEVRQ